MDVGFLFDHGLETMDETFMVWRDRSFTYGWLASALATIRVELDRCEIQPGDIVAVESDYSPNTVVLMLALMERNGIIVPVRRGAPEAVLARIRTVASVKQWIRLNAEDRWEVSTVDATAAGPTPPHPLLTTLRRRRHPGFILFTSGSSGNPKAVVHDVDALLTRFRRPHERLDLLAFLAFDHLGGLNTLFHALSTGGTLYTVSDHMPDTVCAAIAQHRIKILPASPTFFNLMLLSGVHERYDLSSLKLITYGSEPMPQVTLDRLHRSLPGVKIKQTYGLIEVGAFPSQSRQPDSLWVKLGVSYRVVDGILQLKTSAAMLGYLNAPSPFTHDGWFITGDLVEQDGDYLKILGRASELINVGGEKVVPQEVEAVIQERDGIRDVMVYGERNAISGAIVCARVCADETADAREVVRRVKQHCRHRLARHKMPMKVAVTSEDMMTARGKKLRQPSASAGG